MASAFTSTLALTVDPGQALEDDSIDGTVDYGVAFQVIERIITGERRFLIEALALAVGKALTAALSADQARRDHRAQTQRAGAWRARSCRGDRCLARIGSGLSRPRRQSRRSRQVDGRGAEDARRRSADGGGVGLLALPHAALGQDRPARFPQRRGGGSDRPFAARACSTSASRPSAA